MKYLEIKCRNWSAGTQKCVCLSSLHDDMFFSWV